jgi:hypothetical protein
MHQRLDVGVRKQHNRKLFPVLVGLLVFLTSSTPDSPSTYSPFDFVSYYKKLWGVEK